MLADTTNDQRPGADEQYATAINAKSLLVVEHHASAVDVLAAAAWSQSRVGSLLLRLHSEYDGGERARAVGKTDAVMLRQRLKSLTGAQEQLAIRAAEWRMEDPQAKARAALLWWLDKTCPKCQGRKWKTVKGAPHLSGQTCPHPDRGGCGGSGEQRIPHGEEGRRLVGFIEDCLSRARQAIAQRLRSRKS